MGEKSDGKIRVIGRFHFAENSLTVRQKTRLEQISPFYDDEKVEKLLLPVVLQEYDISLRALDWFVVNYCKRKRIVAQTTGPQGREAINIFKEYKDSLRHWRRRNFDPFRRRERVYFSWRDVEYTTTVGQLNFLRWAEQKGVIAQARNNLGDVERDMLTTLGKSKQRRKERPVLLNGKRKRTELTPALPCQCQVFPVEVDVVFDIDR